MADELESYQFEFITIDWVEMYEPAMHDDYVLAWHDVLRGFDDAKSLETAHPPSLFERALAVFGRRRSHPWLRAINQFTEFDPQKELPPATAYLDGIDLSPELDKLHARLLPGNVHQLSVWMPRG